LCKTNLIRFEDFSNFELYRLLGFDINNFNILSDLNLELTTNCDLKIKKSLSSFNTNKYSPKRYDGFFLKSVTFEELTNLIKLELIFNFELIEIDNFIVCNFIINFKNIFWCTLLESNDLNNNQLKIQIQIFFEHQIINTNIIRDPFFDKNLNNFWSSDKSLTNLYDDNIIYRNLDFQLFNNHKHKLEYTNNHSKNYFFVFEQKIKINDISKYLVKLDLSDSFGNNIKYYFKHN
jgi:hypothetical protein